jgi:nitrite transporter NirC
VPSSVPATVDEHAEAAVAKARAARSIGRYLVSSAMAGAYVGLAVVLLIAVSAPLVAVGNPAAKLVQAAVFGLALTLVVFAGAELFTGNAMVMLQGLLKRTTSAGDLARVWVLSLVGNLLGSVAIAALVHAGGTLATAKPGAPAAGLALLKSSIAGKNAASGGQLFARAVLCNMLVCLALWMAARATSDGAKLAVLWWGLLAFIGAGFEHSIANMTLFSLGIFNHSASVSDLARNLAWTVPGNIVGGGLLVGIAYWYVASPSRAVLPVQAAAPLADRVPA